MRADIHDGPEHNTLQAEAGYIDARPQSARLTKPLATRGRTIHRVKSVALCNGRLRLGFRYTLLATKLARHCNCRDGPTADIQAAFEYADIA